jgi:hypothetical protein
MAVDYIIEIHPAQLHQKGQASPETILEVVKHSLPPKDKQIWGRLHRLKLSSHLMTRRIYQAYLGHSLCAIPGQPVYDKQCAPLGARQNRRIARRGGDHQKGNIAMCIRRVAQQPFIAADIRKSLVSGQGL